MLKTGEKVAQLVFHKWLMTDEDLEDKKNGKKDKRNGELDNRKIIKMSRRM